MHPPRTLSQFYLLYTIVITKYTNLQFQIVDVESASIQIL